MFSYFFFCILLQFIDPVTPGIPEFQPPWLDMKINNVTITFQDKVRDLYLGMIITPIVALLVHVTIAKFFGKCKSNFIQLLRYIILKTEIHKCVYKLNIYRL